MHGFTDNYIRVELAPAMAREEYDNQLMTVRLGEFNHDHTALRVQNIVEEWRLYAIVILNWNGRKMLERYLPALVRNTPQQAQIIVADNASTDDSMAFLAAHYPTSVASNSIKT